LFDWVGTYVAIGLLCIIFFVVFYPTFEEWYTKLWEEIGRIREKLRSDKHD
jgi:biopolymer transport protein ExbB/TolQ